jgi:hypothetical protein
MFNSNRYITKGVQENISLELQIFIWDCIDNLSEPKDYLQVFNLSVVDSLQRIIHSTEEPEYKKEYLIPSDNPITEKVYVIDDGDYSTMLLAEEY